MKITLEPNEQYLSTDFQNPTVTIEMHKVDMTMQEVIEELIKPALVAWGFQPSTVDEYFDPDTDALVESTVVEMEKLEKENAELRDIVADLRRFVDMMKHELPKAAGGNSQPKPPVPTSEKPPFFFW